MEELGAAVGAAARVEGAIWWGLNDLVAVAVAVFRG